MTRDEAEDIIITVEAGMGDYYGISRSQYAEALLALQSGDAAEQAAAPDRDSSGLESDPGHLGKSQ